jgi:hypothetical protein
VIFLFNLVFVLPGFLIPLGDHIQRINVQDTIPNTEVLIQARTHSICTTLLLSLIYFAGHVAQTSDLKIFKNRLYSVLKKKNIWWKKKRFKTSLKFFVININTLEDVARYITASSSHCSSMEAWVRNHISPSLFIQGHLL